MKKQSGAGVLNASVLALTGAALVAVVVGTSPAQAQDRLQDYPGYARYAALAPQILGAVDRGSIQATWADDGGSFEYAHGDHRWRYEVDTGRTTDLGPVQAGGNARRTGPARGRQFTSATSPDSSRVATYRDRNLYVSRADGSDEIALSTDGSVDNRIKYGSASWVYGEELGQNTAIWWSPDGSKLGYYRFDESPVPDYFLQMNQAQIQSSLDIEAYPKAGVDNPIVELFVYDLETQRSTKIDVRDGKPWSNDVLGHYVYRVRWSPDGSEIHFNRANRRQNTVEFTACEPSSGECRVVLREEWPDSWVRNSPPMQYLSDNNRFIWTSERNGFRNLFLYNLDGELLSTITQHDFEVANVVRVDEAAEKVYYTARDGDNHMKVQLHVVGFDGRGDERLTDPALTHGITFSPDGKYFLDVAQAHDVPPVTTLRDVEGAQVDVIATSDLTRFEQLGLQKVELFTYKAADGVTELHGILQKPSNFDPTAAYPVLVSVYAGPGSNGASENFAVPDALTEYGFIRVSLDSRSAGGRGKVFQDAIYQRLGVVEVDDQAAGVRSLWDRSYIDKDRVGIYGTSYGGYVSLMAVLRHPDAFSAGAGSSPVTDWRHYDTIYTERYMWIPQENTSGYDAGAAMTYAKDLTGRLMIFYGTADNNVHPSNSMQLIRALQAEGKSFEVQVGPDRGHSGMNRDRMMEFFIENLVLN